MTQYTVVMQHGRPYRVPVEHARKFIRKQELVAQAMGLKDMLKNANISNADKYDAERQLSEIMGKIIRINRRIPPCAIPLWVQTKTY